jgi:hypothetical protein
MRNEKEKEGEGKKWEWWKKGISVRGNGENGDEEGGNLVGEWDWR